MPLPIIPIALWGAGAAVVAAASYYFFSDSDNEDEQKEIKSNVLVLGPKGSGKSTLKDLLANGENSLRFKDAESNTIKIEINEWSFDKENDVGKLKKKIEESKIVIYVIRHDAFNGDREHFNRFKNDFYHIGKQIDSEEGNDERKVLLIVTHCEKPLYNCGNINSFDDVRSSVINLQEYQKVVAQVPRCDLRLVCGSMKTNKYSEDLINKIKEELS